jgi:hypothetical protein
MGDRYLSLESFRVLSSPFDIIGALGPLLTYCILVSIYLGRAYQKHIVGKIGDQKGRERECVCVTATYIHIQREFKRQDQHLAMLSSVLDRIRYSSDRKSTM